MDYIRTPAEAERNAAIQMRELGFHDAEAVPPGPDGGIDANSSRALAQVKWKGAVVGRPDLQRFYGARASETHKQLLFFAASGYSAHAIVYADQHDIALFIYDPTGAIKSQSKAAERLVEEAAWAAARAKQIEEDRSGDPTFWEKKVWHTNRRPQPTHPDVKPEDIIYYGKRRKG